MDIYDFLMCCRVLGLVEPWAPLNCCEGLSNIKLHPKRRGHVLRLALLLRSGLRDYLRCSDYLVLTGSKPEL